MEFPASTEQRNFGEIQELLETASFSLETVHMALSIGKRSRNAYLSLDERLAGGDAEEQEAGSVAVEALENARAAYADLATVLSTPEMDGLGLELRFWSCYAWCGSRLFTDTVRYTGQLALRHELIEARRRTVQLTSRMAAIGGGSFLAQ